MLFGVLFDWDEESALERVRIVIESRHRMCLWNTEPGSGLSRDRTGEVDGENETKMTALPPRRLQLIDEFLLETSRCGSHVL